MIAGTQGIDQGGFPCTRARGRINHDGVLRLENGLHVGHQFQAQNPKFWAAVVNGGQAHGPQNSIRNW